MEFEEIYKTYWQKIYRVCRGYVSDDDWAKDITQDTFIIVWNQLHTFRNESAISTWIYRIAVNNCLKQIEKQKRLPAGNFPEHITETVQIPIDNKIAFLYQCINELKEADRIIISLELEDIKQAEIASIVGISEINVRVKIHRIKEKLTEKFKSYERD
ncbi:RNA polymerase sigma factor [Flavobacterium sp. GT3R68]|uniref:RNA polymerase sigma factor n=1 Tax=Flavobacterium sp. GT3R68 TaxID=2594437 RepID=UPI000F8770C1|nr:RNA polymerase sigma factor [Flavobacterium sp. GT3R68]RTY95146.1 RNA polymerase sigma factor [Flavobacterium sp. GSN2]TRW91112.1 RNA polymerase sigma factor [Flavobacterium sp. GT3R68]